MGEAKREQNNRVKRASKRRHTQRLAIFAVGCALADKIGQSQGRFLPYELKPGYKGNLNFQTPSWLCDASDPALKYLSLIMWR